MRLTYSVRNTGNILLGGRQRVDLRGWFGAAFAPVVADLAPLAPGSSTDVTVEVPRTFPVVHYLAEVSVVPTSAAGDPVGHRVSATLEVWAVPWPMLATLLMLGLGVLAWQLRAGLRGASRRTLRSKHAAHQGSPRRGRHATNGEVLV